MLGYDIFQFFLFEDNVKGGMQFVEQLDGWSVGGICFCFVVFQIFCLVEVVLWVFCLFGSFNSFEVGVKDIQIGWKRQGFLGFGEGYVYFLVVYLKIYGVN